MNQRKATGKNQLPARVYCPEFRLPDQIIKRNKSETNSSESFTRDKPSHATSSKYKGKFNNKDETKDELKAMFNKIKDFNANAESGRSLRAHKEDKLTLLGAPPAKKANIPFKIRLGMMQAKQKRDRRKAEMIKTSDVVESSSSNSTGVRHKRQKRI